MVVDHHDRGGVRPDCEEGGVPEVEQPRVPDDDVEAEAEDDVEPDQRGDVDHIPLGDQRQREGRDPDRNGRAETEARRGVVAWSHIRSTTRSPSNPRGRTVRMKINTANVMTFVQRPEM